jgi:MFS family permease
MQPARARWSTERVVSVAVGILGATIVATGAARAMSILGLLMLVAGGAWIVFISLFSAIVQNLAPEWVRARVLAVFLLVFQGGMALGSVLWGLVGQHSGIDAALSWGGVGTICTAALGLLWRVPQGPADVTPWVHWKAPVVVKDVEPELDDGPVLVLVEYRVAPDRATAFVDAMADYERVRRRDGASRWELFRDTADPERYVETFLVKSWAEHLRQHARQTRGDRRIEERVYASSHGVPSVKHLVATRHRR